MTDNPTDEIDADIVLIAAVAANGVIGSNGRIPWHHPADLAHFKLATTGHPVILGRRTFDNILHRLDEPLPDRTSVVLSRTQTEYPHEDVIVVSDAAEAMEQAVETGTDTIYVAGGEMVYEAFLKQADTLLLTELEDEYEGDTDFPAWPPGDDWTETKRDEREKLSFVTYQRS